MGYTFRTGKDRKLLIIVLFVLKKGTLCLKEAIVQLLSYIAETLVY